MRLLSLWLVLILVFSNPVSGSQAQSGAPATQPATLLRQSLAALVGNTQLSDITLTGTVRRIAGSDDETGTATLQAASNGSARLQLSLSSGTYTEISNMFAAPAGIWSGPDGKSHSQAVHNLLAENAWFSPALVIARRLTEPDYLIAEVAQESRNGQAVLHIIASQQAPAQSATADPYLAQLSQVDLFLDATTLLPAALTFSVHPENNQLVDVPVEVDFADYQTVDGLQVPFHIQKLINNTLQLDFQAQSVMSNTGLAASNFSLK